MDAVVKKTIETSNKKSTLTEEGMMHLQQAYDANTCVINGVRIIAISLATKPSLSPAAKLLSEDAHSEAQQQKKFV